MHPEIYDLTSKLLFWGVTWGTVGLVAFDQLKGMRRMRRGARVIRRQETHRYYQKFQQLRLSRLRAAYPELDAQRQLGWVSCKRQAAPRIDKERQSRLRAA